MELCFLLPTNGPHNLLGLPVGVYVRTVHGVYGESLRDYVDNNYVEIDR